jgi:hypothetical protein
VAAATETPSASSMPACRVQIHLPANGGVDSKINSARDRPPQIFQTR